MWQNCECCIGRGSYFPRFPHNFDRMGVIFRNINGGGDIEARDNFFVPDLATRPAKDRAARVFCAPLGVYWP